MGLGFQGLGFRVQGFPKLGVPYLGFVQGLEGLLQPIGAETGVT